MTLKRNPKQMNLRLMLGLGLACFATSQLSACDKSSADDDEEQGESDSPAPNESASKDSDSQPESSQEESGTESGAEETGDSEGVSGDGAEGDTGLDSDNDGLSDSEELEQGTDPNNPDSDGDGYLDGWEVKEGSDPNDAEDKIYYGGWPYHPTKDEDFPDAPGFEGASTDLGASFVRTKFMDHYGDEFDLYDFAKQGKYTVIDISSWFCPPCQDLARGLGGEDANFNNSYPGLADAVASGELQWATVLSGSGTGQGNFPPPTERDIVNWYNSFNEEHVPILADFEIQMYKPYAWGLPTLIVLDENMQIVHYVSSGEQYPNPWLTLDWIVANILN